MLKKLSDSRSICIQDGEIVSEISISKRIKAKKASFLLTLTTKIDEKAESSAIYRLGHVIFELEKILINWFKKSQR